MAHVSELEGPAKYKEIPSGSPDRAEDLDSLFIPSEVGAEDGRCNDNQEAIRDEND